MRKIVIAIFLLFVFSHTWAQDEECKLRIGTNLSGISDWMTEMPFVDMMHNARTWGTRNLNWVSGGENSWNTQLTDYLETDENGYPLEVPFRPEGVEVEDDQLVFTCWAIISAWPQGNYTLLYDGEGVVDFVGRGEVIESEPGRLVVNITHTENDVYLEMQIRESVRGNHIRNMRLLMPGHEESYEEQPFNPVYLEKLAPFPALRFMDWGSTNNWGESQAWYNYDEPEDTILVPWDQRSKPDNYTYAHSKGVPYEMMVKLCNQESKDMWVCVPHNASDEYIREMAQLIKASLNPDLKVYAEYSNEIWNWMFGQTHWLNKFYCEERGISWPEGLVDRVQNNLNIWNEVFADEPDRLVTVAGGQTSWQDVTNRIVLNLEEGSFDALNITGYFGFSEAGDQALDQLGSSASVADVAYWVRENMEESVSYIKNQHDLARDLDIPLVFYEAGQHITAHPFGEEPSWANALLAIHRDTTMYNIYHEWFNMVEEVFDEGEQSLYMNFSFIGARSARYGSWGILEELEQDTAAIYAPKYHATLDQIYYCGKPGADNVGLYNYSTGHPISVHRLYDNHFLILAEKNIQSVEIYTLGGEKIMQKNVNSDKQADFELPLNHQIYLLVVNGTNWTSSRKIFKSAYNN